MRGARVAPERVPLLLAVEAGYGLLRAAEIARMRGLTPSAVCGIWSRARKAGRIGCLTASERSAIHQRGAVAFWAARAGRAGC